MPTIHHQTEMQVSIRDFLGFQRRLLRKAQLFDTLELMKKGGNSLLKTHLSNNRLLLKFSFSVDFSFFGSAGWRQL